MHKNLKILTFLFFLIFAFSNIFANGAQDENFSDIDEKIESKQYNDALLLLNEYIRNNPEDFDNAQKRVNQVMDVRSDYAKLAEEIIYVIINEPTNDEKKLRMIAELESIEENPSPATKAFIAQTKSAAEFTYYRSKFEEIISKGSQETQNQEYVESLKTNFTGFDLYRTHFHEAGYAEEFVESVELRIAEISNMIANYEAIESTLNIAYKNLITSLDTGNIPQSLKSYNSFESAMKEFADIRNTIVESGWYFKSSFEELQAQDPELTEASFLAFAYRFVLGRTSDENSGMKKALDTIWNYYVEGVKPYLSTQVLANFEALNKQFPKTSLEFVSHKTTISKSILDNTQTLVSIGKNLENLNSLIKVDSENYISVENTEFYESYNSAETIISGFNSTFDSVNRYLAIETEFQDFSIPEESWKIMVAKDHSFKNLIFDLNSKFAREEIFTKDLMESVETQVTTKDWKTSYDILINILSTVEKEYSAKISANGNILSTWYSSGSSEITNSYTATYNQCYEMLNENLSPDILSYPAELQVILQESLVNLPNDIKVLEEIQGFFNEKSFMKTSEQSRIQSDIKTLYSILENSGILIEKAKERVALAELAKNEADLRYSQAEKALSSGDFTSCREYIEKARTKYNESLLYQESVTLRESSDSKLLALGDRIIRSENEIVVKEVRELKNRAKSAYYAGNFESAENILTQAKTRWAATNAELDPEIESLLSLVGTALSMKTGRTIAPTAPLYPEMSQLLNIANQYYNEGKVLLSKGKKTDAQVSFDNALKKLREVQTVYPLNQEASLLTLRINQLVDEKAFNEYFTRKVETAKNDYLDKSKQQTVYAELLDLYEINPSYPGLKDFIYNVEIALGIRVKPPDTSALRKSNQLTAQAQQVFDADSRNEISLNSALQLVNQALEANPDNTEAQILKDRISTSLGGSGTAVLPASAEKLYQQAVQELQKGNILQAYAIVSGLMENKTYSKSAKIIDLMKKVESLL